MSLTKGFEVNTVFDTYTLISQIGEGGNGVVWLAANENKENVAIKFIKRDSSTEKRKRFKNELWFCLNHEHKNIVKVLDFGLLNDADIQENSFYVMPYYSKTLRDRLNEGIKPEDAINIYVGLIEGLKYAHEHGAIHRDIKPENILFGKDDNNPVIADFGIAHFIEEEQRTNINTKHNSKMANFAYRAPEQVQNKNVTGRADIYSATLILNEMFTGEIPASAQIKTIGQVNSEYAFLDNFFNRIYKQDPEERLYPEDTILRDLKICIDDSKLEKEKKRLESIKIETTEFVPYKAEIEDISFDSYRNILSFKMRPTLPIVWGQILTSARYNHSSIFGLGPEKFFFRNDSMCIMLDEYSYENEVPTIVRHFKEWMPVVDNLYNDYRKRLIEQERIAAEEQRKKELEQLEFNQKLKKLI